MKHAILAYLGLRLPLEILVWLSAGSIPMGPGATGMPPMTGPLQEFMRWDSGWYLRIVEHGYRYSLTEQSSAAFFPLFPTLVSGFAFFGLPIPLVSFAVTHVALLLALWGLSELALIHGVNPLSAVAALLLYPLGFFTSAGYAEALFLAFGVWGLVAYERDETGPAGILLACAALTRSQGILLLAAVVLAALLTKPWGWRMALRCTFVGGGFLAAWMVAQEWMWGDALAFLHAREAWGFTGPAWPHVARYAVETWHGVHGYEGWLDFAAVPFLAICGVVSWRRFGAVYGIFCLAILGAALWPGQVWALGRISLCAIPVFLVLAMWASRWPRWSLAMAAAGAFAVAVSGYRFVNGWPTGT